MPAGSISRCETICASLGFSRISGRKYWVRRMAPRPGRRRSLVTVRRAKYQPAKKPRDPVRHFAYYRATSKMRRHIAWPEFREVSKVPAERHEIRPQRDVKEMLAGRYALPSFCADTGPAERSGLPQPSARTDCFTGSGDYAALLSRPPERPGGRGTDALRGDKDGAWLAFLHESGADQHPGPHPAGDG